MHKIIFVLVDSAVSLDPQLIDALIAQVRDHLSEGDRSHQTHIVFVEYCNGFVPVFYVAGEHDACDGACDGVRMIPPDVAVAGNSGYGRFPRLHMIDDFRVRKRYELDPNPNEVFSYHIWHIAVGQHNDAEYPDLTSFKSPAPSWDPNWNLVHDRLKELDINLSMILINPCLINLCPEYQQLLFKISYSGIPLELYASPYHTILLLGFMSPTELEVTVPHSLPISAAHVTQYMADDQRSGTPIFQRTRSDGYMQVSATDPDLIGYKGSQSSSQAAPQTQDLVNANAGRRVGEMSSDVEWIGTLCLNDARVYARARAAEASGDPKLSAWRKDLQLELVQVVDPITTLDIQAWILETKAAVARLSGMDGTDSFDQLVGKVKKGGGYAIVRWDNCGKTVDRLLLAPAGGALLCAAFPDDGIPNRPTHQQPRKIRELKKKKKSKQQPGQPQGTCPAQDAEGSTEGDLNLSNSLDQLARHQVTSLDGMDVDEELDDRQTDAGCAADSSDINSAQMPMLSDRVRE